MINEIKENFYKKETILSPIATKSSEAIRLKEEESDFRTPFFRDVDRIINYSSFTRYSNKTQVFSFLGNDNIQTRIIHVNLVSKISRTIGRALLLNEDLIEAIALGHDIGHCPIGHVGEKILNKISLRELDEVFMHNIESVRNYMVLENDGVGSNLTIQVLDGIMCHNGEKLLKRYMPRKKTKEEFLNDYHNAYKMHKQKVDLTPMTLEGCVVKITDIISYVGRDIEDAIRLGFVNRNEIPKSISEVLGNSNRSIVNTLVTDLINNSYGKEYLEFSDEVYNALMDLFVFNYKNIYNKANSLERLDYYDKVFNSLYSKYLEDLTNKNLDSSIYTVFLNKMSNDYKKETSKQRMIIDYISLMTDEFLIKEYEKNCSSL
jgi:dGTPase